MASSSTPMSNCTSARGGKPEKVGVADMCRNDTWERLDGVSEGIVRERIVRCRGAAIHRQFAPLFAGPNRNANRSRRRRRTAEHSLQERDPLEAPDDTDAAFRVAHRRDRRRLPHQDVLAYLPRRARGG